MNLTLVFNRNYKWLEHFSICRNRYSEKSLTINQFLISRTFITNINISFFNLSQIRNNVVCVVAGLVFMFCCALATGHCKAFQHIFVNQKKWRKLEITSFTAYISRPSYLLLLCLDKENYRPVNVLQHLSNVFERIVYQQLNDYMKDKLSKQLTGFRKDHCTHHWFSFMFEI